MAKSCALPKSTFPRKFKVKSPVHALELARQLIRPFRHWTVGALAVNKEGIAGGSEHELQPKSPRAEAFCALGALKRVNTRHQKKAEHFLKLAAFQMLEKGGYQNPLVDDIFSINDVARDKETHRSVLKMFTRAIRLAKKAE